VAPDPRVRFIGIGSYSYDVEIFAYVLTADWNEFLAIQEELLLQILKTVEAVGTGIAVPTQTTLVRRESSDGRPGRGLSSEELLLPD
jgi:MscS family membrane protein